MELTVQMFLSLDGVVQAPGAPDEDPSGGFAHGGWIAPFGDDVFGTAVVEWFARADAFLLGRHTYEIFSGYWPGVTDPGNPVARALNALPKHVASTTLTSVGWVGASLLTGDVPSAVAALKAQPGRELQVHGSSELVRTLIEHDLVDTYRFFVAPLHLGSGKRLFGDGVRPGSLRLVDNRVTSTGVVISSYQPAGAVRRGTVGIDDEGRETFGPVSPESAP